MPNNRLEYLRPSDWGLISARAKPVNFKAGEEIIKQGSPGQAVYILRKGTASVILGNAREKTTLAHLGPGDICGDMAFLEKGRATASVIAEGDVEADAVPANELERLFESFPGLASRFYRSLAVVLARRLRETSAQFCGEHKRHG